MPAPFTRQSVSERALARVGTTVQGKYRIDRLLGIGGTAAVYAATHRNGHRVAIKFLLDHLLDDSDMYHLFSREAYVANRVGHPGAVQVLDDDEDIDGCVFLIMPLIEGETLRARWERSGKKLPLAEAGVLIADLLDVLATAHAKGVVHRDIKPENLFVNTAAQVRVLDFGIARRAGTESTLTMTGRFIGTPAFMPPEQALGNRAAIGPHSDLWAVGATMFALLSGETVHLAEHSGAQLAAAATQHARSIAKVLPDLPPSIVQFIDKALQFEALDRWPSALCMREALCLALEESLGEKCDVIASRVRERIIAEFAAKAAAEAASGDITEMEPAPDLRSGPARRTPRAETPRAETPRAETPRQGPSPELPPDSVGATALEGSDPRAREVGSGRRNVVDGATLGTGDSGSGPHAADGDVHPVVHDTGSGAAQRGIVSPRIEAITEANVTRSRRRGWMMTVATWVVLIGLAGLTGAGAMRKCGGVGDGTGLTASIGGAVASTNPSAQAALEAGLQLWRDASTDLARAKFGEAAQHDPGLAVAHLYFAGSSEWLDPDVRTHFVQAQSLRRRLTAAQTGLLEALEPVMQEPPDIQSATSKFEALTTKFANDEIAWFVRAAHAIRTQEAARLLSFVDHVPGTLSLSYRSRALIAQGDVDGARKSLQACAAAKPHGGIDCLIRLAQVEANEGACDSSATAARRLIAIDHASPEGYRYLARAEFGRTHRTSSVKAILQERWARLTYPRDELERRRDEYHLAIQDGRFDEAYQILDTLDKASLSTVDASLRVLPFLFRVELDLELGRLENAKATARAAADASQTWLPNETSHTPTEITRLLYLTGLMSREDFRHERARNEADLIAHGSGFHTTPARWHDVYVQIVRDEEDARDAIAHTPAERPLVDAEYDDVGNITEMGRMYLLAGELDKSLQYLQRATNSCLFAKAVYGVHAHAWYGDALGKSGKKSEACEQYRYVLERWGHDARSITANATRQSALRLGCPGVTEALPPKRD